MLDNPYQAPASHPPIRCTHDYLVVKSMLRPPAISLIVLSALAIVLDLCVLTHAIVGDAPKMLRDEGPDKGRELIVTNLVANGLLIVIHAIVLYGSLQMLKVRSYASAMTAAIVSLFPFCSPVVLVGVPFGVWALLVLGRDGVKGTFRGETAPIVVLP